MKRAVLIFSFFLIALTASAQDAGTVKDGMQAIADRYGVHFVYDSSLPVDRPFTGQSFRNKRMEDAIDILLDGTGIKWQRKKRYIILKAEKPVQIIASREKVRMDTISAACISGKIDMNANFTQTGLAKINGAAFNRAFAAFSSPDLVKTLQLLPGVSAGTELLSNLYVHGGDGSDNLFLLDGVPLYQVCHLGGIFSSFNTDVIEQVDFYKSGFPARYGGRTSSVVDVDTKEGDFNNFKGQASIGLLDGRVQFEGPIVKNRTSFNLAVRRSWADAIMYPVCMIQNAGKRKAGNNEEESLYGYSFIDLNAKVTHKISSDSKIEANLYYGNDSFIWDGNLNSAGAPEGNREEDNLKMSWGNFLASLRWQAQLSRNMDMDVTGFWSASRAAIGYHFLEETNSEFNKGVDRHGVDSHNVLDDIGITANFKWVPVTGHQIRFGGSGIGHSYRPDYNYYETSENVGTTFYDLSQKDTVRATAFEISVYAEDEVAVTRRVKANIGFRNTVYLAEGKAWNYFEPRLALKIHCADNVNAKLSYAKMSQFSHRVASTYLDLPTNCWLPSTATLAPMSSHQFAGGVYSKPAKDVHINVEGWYKTMSNLVEYYGDRSLFPRLKGWESVIFVGRGRSYGVEFDAGYETQELVLNAFYTLSWNERNFEQIYRGWYRDRNDNRHKLTLMANWRVNKKWELYGAWNYHSGNRMTMPTQYLQGIYSDGEGYGNSFYHQWVYEEPNNVKLPDYHRLDLGANIYGKTRRGNRYVWNISIYNAYCRFNPIFAVITREGENKSIMYEPGYVAFRGRGIGVVPLLPSFCYKISFGQ